MATIVSSIALSLYAQKPSGGNDDTGIPPGHKVIALYFAPPNKIPSLVKKGDRVDVVAMPNNGVVGRTVANNALVFSNPKRSTNGVDKTFVAVLVTEHDGNRIQDARERGAVQLAVREAWATRAKRSFTGGESFVEEGGTERSRREKEVIRALTKELDEIAAKLEELEMYERADEIREKAQSVRLDIRK